MTETISISQLLNGEDPKGKIVDMGFWCDVPHINSRVCKILKEKGAAGLIVEKYSNYWDITNTHGLEVEVKETPIRTHYLKVK